MEFHIWKKKTIKHIFELHKHSTAALPNDEFINECVKRKKSGHHSGKMCVKCQSINICFTFLLCYCCCHCCCCCCWIVSGLRVSALTAKFLKFKHVLTHGIKLFGICFDCNHFQRQTTARYFCMFFSRSFGMTVSVIEIMSLRVNRWFKQKDLENDNYRIPLLFFFLLLAAFLSNFHFIVIWLNRLWDWDEIKKNMK